MTDKPDNVLSLGQFIAYKRNYYGYKKIQFSKILGITDDTLRYWERDRFIPAGKNRTALIRLLKITKEEVKYYFGSELYGQTDIIHS